MRCGRDNDAGGSCCLHRVAATARGAARKMFPVVRREVERIYHPLLVRVGHHAVRLDVRLDFIVEVFYGVRGSIAW